MTRDEIICRLESLFTDTVQTIEQKDKVVKLFADSGQYDDAAKSHHISLGIFWFKQKLQDIITDITEADDKMAAELGVKVDE